MEIALYTLWSIATHLKPACVALCARCCFVSDSNATISFFFFFIRNWDSPRGVISLPRITRLLVNTLALCKPSSTTLLNINYGPLCNRASSRNRAGQYALGSTPLTAFCKLDLSTICELYNRKNFVLSANIEALI